MKTLASLLPLAFATATFAAEPMPALEACRALPKPQQKMIARIAGHGGTPLPDNWIVVVHDPVAQNGLKEYTVTAGEVRSSRGISDFATRITEGDIIGMPGIKFDATQVAELAAAYADANELRPVSFNYELRKDGADAAPLWKISATDAAGMTLGEIVVTANTGKFVAQTGFAKEPASKDLAVLAEEDMADDAQDEKQDKSTHSGTKSSSSKSASSSARKVPATFKRIGGHLQKFFTGKSTIGR